MEEYDCHSSAEHSPSGYYHRQNFNNVPDLQNHHQKSSSQQPDVSMIPGKNSKTSHIPSLIMPYAKDLRRKAGHWSNTNLESQLDFIP
ncbi:hypothetical protein BLA29_011097 [Euroglyphus maynei]|uniref:Uncharacterized protein n=1 Tax=Euroglyphus maynei TaxID=6958 RepID=A0A1Y3B8V9_EURMA|nr:hypothetical protein BLA29_011097 [Euroglyphus maynei]